MTTPLEAAVDECLAEVNAALAAADAAIADLPPALRSDVLALRQRIDAEPLAAWGKALAAAKDERHLRRVTGALVSGLNNFTVACRAKRPSFISMSGLATHLSQAVSDTLPRYEIITVQRDAQGYAARYIKEFVHDLN